jgi:uncharacterized RDD family membrane protein YckC
MTTTERALRPLERALAIQDGGVRTRKQGWHDKIAGTVVVRGG